jgi:hypothetical protein
MGDSEGWCGFPAEMPGVRASDHDIAETVEKNARDLKKKA